MKRSGPANSEIAGEPLCSFEVPQAVFSLVLATIGRIVEVEHFLQSLVNQSFTGVVELIVVDQNEDDRLVSVLNVFETDVRIVHLKSKPGLSRARNLGIQRASGMIIGFPDDDCWYPRELLDKIYQQLLQHPKWGGITGVCVDEEGIPAMARFDTTGGRVSRSNVWNRAVSIGIFMREDLIKRIGLFDVNLGAGSGTAWGSGEETDYLIRAISSGAEVMYLPEVVVGHPRSDSEFSEGLVKRYASYAAGTGYVLRKHRYASPYVVRAFVRPLLGSVLALLVGKKVLAKARMVKAVGVLYGWLSCPENVMRGKWRNYEKV